MTAVTKNTPSNVISSKCKKSQITMLLARYTDGEGHEYGPIHTVPNEVLFIEKTSPTKLEDCDKDGYSQYGLAVKISPLVSTKSGALHLLRSDFTPGMSYNKSLIDLEKETDIVVKVFSPSLDAMSFLFAIHGKSWVDEMAKLLKELGAQTFQWGMYALTDMRKPLTEDKIKSLKDENQRQVETAYVSWYRLQESNNVPEPKIQGLYFNKVRAIIITFSSINFLNAVVKIWKHNGDKEEFHQTTVEKHQKIELYAAVIFGLPDELPSGLYNVEVSQLEIKNKNKWSKSVTDKGYYQLKENFRFDLKNLSGDYELVNGDPITLEETLIQQFPLSYKHLVENATYAKDQHLKSKEDKKLVIPGLESYAHQLNLNHSKAKIVYDLLGADSFSSKGWAFASMVQWVLPKDSIAEKGVDLVFKGKKFYEAANSVITYTRATALSIKRNPTAGELEELRGIMERPRAWTDEHGVSTYSNTFFHRLKLPENVARGIDKLTRVINVVFEVETLANMSLDIKKTRDRRDANIKLMKDIAADYHMQLHEEVTIEGANANSGSSQDDLVNEVGKLTVEDLSWLNKDSKVSYTTLFDVDKAKVKSEFEVELQKVVDFMNDNQQSIAVLESHTDTDYKEKYNFSLSQRRGMAVREWLIKKGIAGSRLIVHAYGEAYPVIEAGAENFKKSRRVDIILNRKMRYLHYAPCREAMTGMEKYRSMTIIDDLDLDDKWLALIDQAFATAAGWIMVPGVQLAAAVVLVAKEAVSLFSWLDREVLNRYFTMQWENYLVLNRLWDSAEANKMLMRNLANQDKKDIMPAEVDRQPEDPEATRSLHLQYRLRAEALYGLVALFARAANETNDEADYQRVLKKYKVEAYIENFILNDQWQFPLKRVFALNMDEFWLYAISSFGYNGTKPYIGFGLDKEGRIDKVAQQSPQSNTLIEKFGQIYIDVLYGVFFGAQGLYTLFTDQPNSIRADYSRIFPIHFQASEDLKQLAEVFKTKFTELDDDDIYEFTAIYWRRRGYFKNKDWELLETKLKSAHPAISPMDQVRVIIVLKEAYTGMYPIRIQLSRTDGLDINGPVYKKLTRPLSKTELLPTELKRAFAGRNGAVFNPFYQFGQNTIAGTKPMANNLALFGIDAQTYQWLGQLDNMRYMFEVTVGKLSGNERKNQTTRTVRVTGEERHYQVNKNPWYDDVLDQSEPSDYGYQFLVTLYSMRIHRVPDVRKFKNTNSTSSEPYTKENCVMVQDEGLLLNNDFLVSRVQDSEYPTLFTDRFWEADGPELFVMMRLGGKGEYFLVDERYQDIIDSPHNAGFGLKREDNTLLINQFDWKTQVEFIFVVIAKKLEIKTYREMKLDWRNIPFSVDLMEHSMINNLGPRMTPNLNYIGKIEKTFSATDKMHHWRGGEFVHNGLDINLNTIQDKIRFLDYRFQSLCNFDENAKTSQQRYIYAGYYNCEYLSLAGNTIKSLRPFGALGVMNPAVSLAMIPPVDLPIYRVTDSGNSGNSPFIFGFTHFKSRGKTGINMSKDKLKTKIQIAEPASYIDNVPWTDISFYRQQENPKQNAIYDRWLFEVASQPIEEKIKRVRKWIEVDGQATGQKSPARAL